MLVRILFSWDIVNFMDYAKTTLFAFLGGVIAWFLLLFLPGSGPLFFNLIRGDLVEFLGKGSAPTPTPTVIVSPDFWQKIVSDQILSTVAIQSFSGGKVAREGSGIIISSDGIIITTFDVVSGAEVIQVFHKDKILRAQVMRYNDLKNLAILKVGETNMDVTRLERSYQFQPGQDVVVSGKTAELSVPVVFAQRGMISYILSKEIVVDTKPAYFLSGSKVINNSGVVIGMAYLRNGTVRLITAETVDDFVKSYFETF